MTSHSAHERIPAFTIGDRLRKAREDKTGLDQGPFAQELGISRGTVSHYERAGTIEGMKRPYLMAWAMRCDVPLEWLLTGDQASTTPPDSGPGIDSERQARLDQLASRKRRGPRGNTPGSVTVPYAGRAA